MNGWTPVGLTYRPAMAPTSLIDVATAPGPRAVPRSIRSYAAPRAAAEQTPTTTAKTTPPPARATPLSPLCIVALRIDPHRSTYRSVRPADNVNIQHECVMLAPKASCHGK